MPAIGDGGETMIQLTIDMPEGALAAVHHDPQEFTQALRLAAAVKWYEMRRISQGRAAEIAGLSRSEFLTALGLFGVSPFQEEAAEILEAATRA
jgi:predicted HTH domain antitoxin